MQFHVTGKCFKSTLYLFLSLPFGEEMYPTEKLAFGSLLYVQNDLSFRVLSRPPMKIRLSIGGRNLRLADYFLIGWFPSGLSILAHFSVLAGKIFAMDVIRYQTSAEIIF